MSVKFYVVHLLGEIEFYKELVWVLWTFYCFLFFPTQLKIVNIKEKKELRLCFDGVKNIKYKTLKITKTKRKKKLWWSTHPQ
jgi:hypothetical protein